MRQPILKSILMPPHIFGVPFVPAFINFAVQMGIMVMCITVFHTNPLMFVFLFLGTHFILFLWARKDPHFDKLLMLIKPLQLFKKQGIEPFWVNETDASSLLRLPDNTVLCIYELSGKYAPDTATEESLYQARLNWLNALLKILPTATNNKKYNVQLITFHPTSQSAQTYLVLTAKNNEILHTLRADIEKYLFAYQPVLCPNPLEIYHAFFLNNCTFAQTDTALKQQLKTLTFDKNPKSNFVSMKAGNLHTYTTEIHLTNINEYIDDAFFTALNNLPYAMIFQQDLTVFSPIESAHILQFAKKSSVHQLPVSVTKNPSFISYGLSVLIQASSEQQLTEACHAVDALFQKYGYQTKSYAQITPALYLSLLPNKTPFALCHQPAELIFSTNIGATALHIF